MNERILLEPLRERLYYACDAFVTYIDSRVLIFDSNELPQNPLFLRMCHPEELSMRISQSIYPNQRF